MIIYSIPIVVIAVFFYFISTKPTRGELGEAVPAALLLGFCWSFFALLLIPLLATWAGPYDRIIQDDKIIGDVEMTVSNDTEYYSFETEKGKQIISNDDIYFKIIPSDESRIVKACEDTPEWAAYYQMGECELHIYTKDLTMQ